MTTIILISIIVLVSVEIWKKSKLFCHFKTKTKTKTEAKIIILLDFYFIMITLNFFSIMKPSTSLFQQQQLDLNNPLQIQITGTLIALIVSSSIITCLSLLLFLCFLKAASMAEDKAWLAHQQTGHLTAACNYSTGGRPAQLNSVCQHCQSSLNPDTHLEHLLKSSDYFKTPDQNFQIFKARYIYLKMALGTNPPDNSIQDRRWGSIKNPRKLKRTEGNSVMLMDSSQMETVIPREFVKALQQKKVEGEAVAANPPPQDPPQAKRSGAKSKLSMQLQDHLQDHRRVEPKSFIDWDPRAIQDHLKTNLEELNSPKVVQDHFKTYVKKGQIVPEVSVQAPEAKENFENLELNVLEASARPQKLNEGLKMNRDVQDQGLIMDPDSEEIARARGLVLSTLARTKEGVSQVQIQPRNIPGRIREAAETHRMKTRWMQKVDSQLLDLERKTTIRQLQDQLKFNQRAFKRAQVAPPPEDILQEFNMMNLQETQAKDLSLIKDKIKELDEKVNLAMPQNLHPDQAAPVNLTPIPNLNPTPNLKLRFEGLPDRNPTVQMDLDQDIPISQVIPRPPRFPVNPLTEEEKGDLRQALLKIEKKKRLEKSKRDKINAIKMMPKRMVQILKSILMLLLDLIMTPLGLLLLFLTTRSRATDPFTSVSGSQFEQMRGMLVGLNTHLNTHMEALTFRNNTIIISGWLLAGIFITATFILAVCHLRIKKHKVRLARESAGLSSILSHLNGRQMDVESSPCKTGFQDELTPPIIQGADQSHSWMPSSAASSKNSRVGRTSTQNLAQEINQDPIRVDPRLQMAAFTQAQYLPQMVPTMAMPMQAAAMHGPVLSTFPKVAKHGEERFEDLGHVEQQQAPKRPQFTNALPNPRVNGLNGAAAQDTSQE